VPDLSDLKAKLAAKRRELEAAKKQDPPPQKQVPLPKTHAKPPPPPPPPKQERKPDVDQTIPHSVEAEKGILSSILVDCQQTQRFDVIAEVAGSIQPWFFFVPAHKTIYEVMLSLYRDGTQIDFITFPQILGDRGLLDGVGGPGFITEIFTFVPTAANVQYYVEIVRDKFILRETIATGTRIVRAAYGAQDDEAADILDDFSRRIERIKTGISNRNGIEAFPVEQLLAADPTYDPNTLVGRRWLVRGGNCLWAGGSGYGKSSLEMQLAIYWGCNTACFGLKPVRSLKSLIIQAENNENDTAEQLQGVVKGIENIGDLDVAAQREHIQKNIAIYRAIGKTGGPFLSLLDNLIQTERPDIVWIDPLFAFAGCDLMNAEKTGKFLREGLFPIAHQRGVCLNVLHHIGKPPKDANAQAPITELDYQYLGFGTSEIQNAFRAVNILVPVKKGGGFKLVLSKRGERAGAKDIEGEWARELFLQHSREGICWLQATPPDDIEGDSDKFSKEDILDEMSVVNALKTDTIYRRCYREKNAKRATFYRLWKELKKEKRIKPSEGGWIRCGSHDDTAPVPSTPDIFETTETTNETENETNAETAGFEQPF
jgi:DnaB helicase-like protein/AAA domain-containing protein